MANTKKAQAGTHTADELLDLAVQWCFKQERMPKKGEWRWDSPLDFEEIVKVLGKGTWERASLVILLAWDQKQRKMRVTEDVVEHVCEEKVTEARTEKEAPKAEVSETESRRRGRRQYTLDELRKEFKRVQEHFGTTGIPGQVQFYQAAREIGTPSYPTFLRGFGPKAEWEEFLEKQDSMSM